MSFSHLHTALLAHAGGELLPEDTQRWLLAGLARFVQDDVSLEKSLGLTRRRFLKHLRDTALREAYEHLQDINALMTELRLFGLWKAHKWQVEGIPHDASDLDKHLFNVFGSGIRLPNERQLRRIIGEVLAGFIP